MSAWGRAVLAVVLVALVACEEKKPARLPPPFVGSEVPEDLVRLQRAYPEQIQAVTSSEAVLASGARIPYRNGREAWPFELRLAQASLKDQMSMPYPAGPTYAVPNGDNDPGRLRNLLLFEAMYGANETEVRGRLAVVRWLERRNVLVTSVNGVDKALSRVSAALMRLPAHIAECASHAGTFAYRPVRSGDYLSPHGFGIAIDLSRSCSNYWYWDRRRNADGSPAYVNRMPIEIVLAFEREGFIWGGKWAHYDTMHFEYRPELLVR